MDLAAASNWKCDGLALLCDRECALLTDLAGLALVGAGAGAGLGPGGLGLDGLAAYDALVLLQVGPEGLHVRLVHVVDDDGGDGDDLGGSGRHHRHEDEEQHRVFAGRAEELLSDQRCGEACASDRCVKQ